LIASPHVRDENVFWINLDELKFSKNIDNRYMPKVVIVPTTRNDLQFFDETMIFNISNASINYKYGK
jgi:hypothetical protein